MTPRFERADRVLRAILYRVAEFGLIITFLLAVTSTYQDFAPDRRASGNELSYLINSGAIASIIYARTGAIPLWNPFMGPSGEPLLENPFSFVLNPFMTVPFFAFGILHGPKIGVLIHVMIMALGGWALANVLRLRAPGRVLLSLLLGGLGSMAGMTGLGFYQMGLSLSYVPWVFTGLFGLLYGEGRTVRRHVGIFVVSGTLLTFAGTFWYTLPTAISGVLFTLFAVFVRREGYPRFGFVVDFRRVRRLLGASLLLVGLAAIRLIPQAVNNGLVNHPVEALPHYYDFFDMARLYFIPNVPETEFINLTSTHYHYTVPLVMFLASIGAWLVFARTPGRWRVLVPAGLLIGFYTIWAQEGTPFLRWLYHTIPLLTEWRFPGRMLAAATPLVALVTAVCADDALHALVLRLTPLRPRLRLGFALRATALVILFGLGVYSAYDVPRNWDRVTASVILRAYQLVWFNDLRQKLPNKFLSVYSFDFFNYYPYYPNLIRAANGNPDYRPGSIPPTIGMPRLFDYSSEYAFADFGQPRVYLQERGYKLIEDTPDVAGIKALWYNADLPGYAFIASRGFLNFMRDPIHRADVEPVESYTHNVNSIEVRLKETASRPPGGILVLTETAYPGWMVTIDGRPAPLESVGGMIGVAVPEHPAVIVFTYRPPLLYVSAFVSAIAALVFTGFLFRLERLLTVPKPPSSR